jgi:hypothetical protein
MVLVPTSGFETGALLAELWLTIVCAEAADAASMSAADATPEHSATRYELRMFSTPSDHNRSIQWRYGLR